MGLGKLGVCDPLEPGMKPNALGMLGGCSMGGCAIGGDVWPGWRGTCLLQHAPQGKGLQVLPVPQAKGIKL
jgi:hypothetical protein